MARMTHYVRVRTIERFLEALTAFMRTIRHLRSTAALLSWDQETNMPAHAAERRAQQLATLEELIHREFTALSTRRLAERAQELLPSLPDSKQPMVRLFLREYRRIASLPRRLLRELAYTQALAVESWRYARRENDFSLLAPYLRKILELKREQTECYGYTEHPYDALLELYEPNLRLAQLHPLLTQVAEKMRHLLAWVHERPHPPTPSFRNPVPCAAQFMLGRSLCEAIGFNPQRGRIDYSTHPFCVGLAPEDVRITTRCQESDPRVCIYSLLHELGHALYEQNLPTELADTFAGEGASTALHESQSLLWEDIIGRSFAFCRWATPLWRRYFHGDLDSPWQHLTPEELFAAVNLVRPSLIRTEADEVTYHLHILLRLELEVELLRGTLPVRELPEAWNAGMQRLLGLRPPDDRTGCLQDIHWALGDFGYFPSYTLGKLYAAMFWRRLQEELPDVEEAIADGEFTPILQWLYRHIYSVGALETPTEILQRVTGKPLTPDDFVEYITAKVHRVYAHTL